MLYCIHWNENPVAFALDEKSLEDKCYSYWMRYLVALSDSIDGQLLFEQANLNMFRQLWLDKRTSIKCLRASKRFISHQSMIEKITNWLVSIPTNSSLLNYEIHEIDLLGNFPESFVSLD